jgi:hypothetical protein
LIVDETLNTKLCSFTGRGVLSDLVLGRWPESLAATTAYGCKHDRD